MDNLKEAINGESNAKRKYEMFAEIADKENHPQIARLFKAISIAESIHIKNHIKALSVITNSEVNTEKFVKVDEEALKEKIKSTELNLIDAMEGELFETKKMYKNFIKNSKKENKAVAELTFTLARKAEKKHASLYRKYHNLLMNKKPIEVLDLFICQICGNVELDNAPDVCPICDHSKNFFQKL